MNHTVQVHEETYLPVSPSKQTREQLDEQAAGSLPLDAAAGSNVASASADAAADDEDYEEY